MYSMSFRKMKPLFLFVVGLFFSVSISAQNIKVTIDFESAEAITNALSMTKRRTATGYTKLRSPPDLMKQAVTSVIEWRK